MSGSTCDPEEQGNISTSDTVAHSRRLVSAALSL